MLDLAKQEPRAFFTFTAAAQVAPDQNGSKLTDGSRWKS